MTIQELQDRAWKTNEEHGFHLSADDNNFVAKMMLVVTELAEAVEEWRNHKPSVYSGKDGKPEGVGIEIADAVIRLADICGMERINLQQCLDTKMAFNNDRPYRHGGKRI